MGLRWQAGHGIIDHCYLSPGAIVKSPPGMEPFMTQAIQKQSKPATEPYWNKFERANLEGKQPSWLFPLRKAAMTRFAELGFPTVDDEDWRFTNVAPIARLPFQPVAEYSPGKLD